MGIVLFLVDNSASMNQRTYTGTNLLDIAKTAVENFVKLRSRDPASRQDRYMLVTYDSPPFCFKSGWRETHAVFSSELKNMAASGLSNFGAALQQAFDLLNIHRLQTGIDNYGQGRNPFYLEPSAVVAMTDGGHSTANIADDLVSKLCGNDLTKEGFRWDQKLFLLQLQYPGFWSSLQEPSGTMDPHLAQLCESTGGRSYLVTSPKSLNQSLESLVQKLQPGVVLHFERLTENDSPVAMEIENDSGRMPTPEIHQMGVSNGSNDIITNNTALLLSSWEKCRRTIYVRFNPKTGIPSGHWPIPESFWPEPKANKLVPRMAHPVVLFSCEDTPPMVIDNLPFDKYELEPSPLTQHILGRKLPQACWKVFVGGSGKTCDSACPFGYLKPSTNLQSVNLLVMPYNYTVALPLLDELVKKYKMKPPRGWKLEFDKYLLTVPPYYFQPLRNALRLMGAPSGIMSESPSSGLSSEIISHLKKLKKQAKVDGEQLLASIGCKPTHNEAGLPLGSNGLPSKETIVLQCHRNPFDIPRSDLLDQLKQMRTVLFNGALTQLDAGNRHSVPIGQMGNYQEFRRNHYFLREIEENPERKTQLFGNPYRLEKATDKVALPDEANEAMVGIGTNNRKRLIDGGNSRKRRRSVTPPASPQPRKMVAMETGRGSVLLQKSDVSGKDVVNKAHTPKLNSTANSKSLDNTALKKIIIKELRQFKLKNYTVLFEHLNLVKGSIDVQKLFLQDIIKEANRLKKKTLVLQLEEWGQNRLARTEVRS